MTYTQDNPRDTCAGLLVTKDPITGIWHLATHHPRSALKAREKGDAGWRQHTTVGGGIKPTETPMLGMLRELREEYGARAMMACEVTRLDAIPPKTLFAQNSQKWNRYHWFFINCPFDVELEPNQNEIVGMIDWYPCTTLEPYSSPLLVPQQKREMLWQAIHVAQQLFPEVFDLQKAA